MRTAAWLTKEDWVMKRVVAIAVLVFAASSYGAPTVADLGTTPGNVAAPLVYMGQLSGSLANEAMAANTTQVFLERESVTLAVALALSDGSSILAGTAVSSYIVHFDPVGTPTSVYEGHGTITFDRPVLGVIYATNDTSTYTLLTASDTAVGLGPAFYDADPLQRKLEIPQATWQDVVSFSGNVVTVNLFTTSSMDEVRIITACPVPAPGALALLALGTGLVGWLHRRNMLP
jgi:hypothetical protein